MHSYAVLSAARGSLFCLLFISGRYISGAQTQLAEVCMMRNILHVLAHAHVPSIYVEFGGLNQIIFHMLHLPQRCVFVFSSEILLMYQIYSFHQFTLRFKTFH